MRSPLRQLLHNDDGVVMLEFLLAFPLVLTLVLAVVQFSHLWIARQVVHYAAYCAARSMLVVQEGEYLAAGQQAAIEVCKWISIGRRAGQGDLTMPGSGVSVLAIPGSGGVVDKTVVTPWTGDWHVGATVAFDFALITPLVGPMLGWSMNPWDSDNPWDADRDARGVRYQDDLLEYPHVRLTETVWLPKPYVTITAMALRAPPRAP